MATQKCTNKGCGKTFTDPEEPCVHHPGPPIFHEGQKGWKCCKPRVLTFDEFLSIPPCTTGKHSTAEISQTASDLGSGIQRGKGGGTGLSADGKEVLAPTPLRDGQEPRSRLPVAEHRPTPPPQPKDKPAEEDDPSIPVPPGAKCKRNACEVEYEGEDTRKGKCVHHPGNALFHEGSKGWTCCKRRVLEFSEFLKIGGCSEGNHLFVGSKEDVAAEAAQKSSEVNPRTDFYQTYTHVNVSIFLKKVDKEQGTIKFSEMEMDVDLPTADRTRFKDKIPLFGPIVPEESTFTVKGTKVEAKLKKADGTAWSTLRSDEESDHIIQIGRPGVA